MSMNSVSKAQNVYQINKQVNYVNKSASEILGKLSHSLNLQTLLSNGVSGVISGICLINSVSTKV